MRTLIDTFDRRFFDLNGRTAALIKTAGDDRLYIATADGNTVGELVLRSAGAVEQMIGGVTRRLWDDPFEWTLRERMPTVEAITAYLEEVEISRRAGFRFFRSDEDLNKLLPAPLQMRSLHEVLTDTLDRAEQYYAKAETLLASLAE